MRFADGAEDARDDDDGEVGDHEGGRGGLERWGSTAVRAVAAAAQANAPRTNGHERAEGAAHGQVGAVEKDPGGDSGGSGERGHDDGGEDAAKEIAPVREGGGPPPLQDAGFAGGDEAHAVGVPGGEGETEDGVAGDVGGGGVRVAVGGDEQDDGKPDADGDRPATGQQAAPGS